ncbi:hypothetical protein HKD37_U058680 [Glycine soja]
MAKPSSPTNLASAIICFFASKKFPHRLKASPGRFARQNPSPQPFRHGPCSRIFQSMPCRWLFVTKFGGHIGYIIGGLSAKNHS